MRKAIIRSTRRLCPLLLVLAAVCDLSAENVTLVATGSVWKYFDLGISPGAEWNTPDFDDGAWASGPGQLGYGDGHEATLVSYGADEAQKYTTTWFRRRFSASEVLFFTNLTLSVVRDDGAVVYLNGVEIWRSNMPGGTISPDTLASASVGSDENTFLTTGLSAAALHEGENVLAVEIHQANRSSPDLSFDLGLKGNRLRMVTPPGSPLDGVANVNRSATLQVSPIHQSGSGMTVKFYGRVAPPAPGRDFSMVVLPDAQNYTAATNGGSPQMLIAQADWVATNRQALNIAFATQLGDLSTRGDSSVAEWRNATNALYRLENPARTGLPQGLPYGVAVGNHDMTPKNNPDGTTTLFNQYFGQAHFSGRAYYGGHYGTNNDNHYEWFSASGLNFMVLHLEYDSTPASAVLNWAGNLLKSNPGRRAIVVSHSILNSGSAPTFSSQGQAIYNALKDNKNLILMLCGHVGGEAQREDLWEGNSVYTLLSDYQSRTNGGNGWLRLMQFSPSNNVIRVQTYSPWVNKWETDANSQFTLGCDLDAGAAFTLVGTQAEIPSGGTASCQWPGLEPSKSYQWYVTLSDGAETIASRSWRFTSAPNALPSVVLTEPAEGEVYSSSGQVALRAEPSDPDGVVSRVQFLADGELIGEATASPWTHTWNRPWTGAHLLTAVATDQDGGSASSAPVRVTVVPNLHPLVSITTPLSGARYAPPADITVSAAASDPDGKINRVEFYSGANRLGWDNRDPYSWSWPQVSAGNYVLTAVAQDASGLRSTSAPVHVTVSSSMPSDGSAVVLGIARLAESIVLSWGTNHTAYQLETRRNLSGAQSWTPWPGTPLQMGGSLVVTNALTNHEAYYRLRRP